MVPMIEAPIFIVGLNKSGTSLLYLMLSRHPALSAIRAFKRPKSSKNAGTTLNMEDHHIGEGQKIPDLIEKLRPASGSGRWACPEFLDRYRLTEAEAEPGDRESVSAAYERAMTNPDARLVEKSPPNTVRTRFLQALFPDATFIHIVRDPYANIAANAKKRDKWGSTDEQAVHWAAANGTYLEDSARLTRAMTIRYEALVARPDETLQAVCDFCGIERSAEMMVPVEQGLNEEMTALLSKDEIDGISEIISPRLFRAFGYRRKGSWRRLLPWPTVSRVRRSASPARGGKTSAP